MNSRWKRWKDRSSILNADHPGIYFLALTDQDFSDQEFSMRKEIIYIGMTISVKGVLGRLYQFERAILGFKDIHGGGDRVRYWLLNKSDIPNEQSFLDSLYVSAKIFPVSNTKNTPDDWRQKGEVAKHEYTSFADYFEKYDHLPQFNDPKRSPKK